MSLIKNTQGALISLKFDEISMFVYLPKKMPTINALDDVENLFLLIALLDD